MTRWKITMPMGPGARLIQMANQSMPSTMTAVPRITTETIRRCSRPACIWAKTITVVIAADRSCEGGRKNR